MAQPLTVPILTPAADTIGPQLLWGYWKKETLVCGRTTTSSFVLFLLRGYLLHYTRQM